MDEKYVGLTYGLIGGVIASAPTGRPELTIPVGIAIGLIVDAYRARLRSRADRIDTTLRP